MAAKIIMNYSQGNFQRTCLWIRSIKDYGKKDYSRLFERTIPLKLELFEVSVCKSDPAYSHFSFSLVGIDVVGRVEVPAEVRGK
ncbi:hypothetical protein CW304_19665 [Bacillus sp. UFRGS-B20]|nr:hypothetical protein CW304_19665 [Bacillus sp. UFRGS-B20]